VHLQHQMLEVSPLIPDMEEELLGWKVHTLKVVDLVATKCEWEVAAICALEEACRLDAEVRLAVEAEAMHKAELEVRPGKLKETTLFLDLSDDMEELMMVRVFLFLFFIFELDLGLGHADLGDLV
jgi:hypothetical protein